MADTRLSAKATTTDPIDGWMHILKVDGVSGSGYASRRIKYADFQTPLTTQITANANAIAINTHNIIEIGEALYRYSSMLSSNIQMQQNGNSVLTDVFLKVVSGTPSVAIGTTANAEDVVSLKSIDGFRAISSASFSENNRALFISVADGVAEVVMFFKLNLFT